MWGRAPAVALTRSLNASTSRRVEERCIGNHVLRFEGADFVVVEMSGVIQPGEIHTINEVFHERLFAEGRLFVLCFTANVTGMDPAARRESKARPRNPPPTYAAILGASFVSRVVIDMIMRAANLLADAKLTHRFFSGEAEARAWLEEMRARQPRSPRP